METRANFVVIGAFTVLVAVAAVIFGLFTARFATDKAWDRYEILFEESVMGLSEGSSVVYNGVNVGRVADIELYRGDVRQVRVEVEIEGAVPIHRDTVATLRLTGLTGTAVIQLSGGTPDAPLLEPQRRGLPRIESRISPLNRLVESSEGIVVTANRIMNQLGDLLDEANLDRVRDTLVQVERFSATLNDPDSDLNRLLAGAAEASERLPDLVERLDATTARVNDAVTRIDRGLVDGLPELRGQLERTLANLESLTGRLDRIVASNQDELSRIGGVGMRQLGGGLEDIRQLVRRLSDLVRQIEQDPARFLLGGEQPEEYPIQ